MSTAGQVGQLWRFPVKSFQGERLESLDLGMGGFQGDRAYGIVDRSSGKTLTAKTIAELLFASARWDGGQVVITLPDDREFEAEDPAASEAIASWLGRDCELRRADSVTDTSYDMTFDPEDDSAPLVSIPVAPGTFFDLTPVHILTTGTLATMAAAHPRGDWQVRRFRPNVLIETPPPEGGAVAPPEPVTQGTTHPGFPEDGWAGGTLVLGAASVNVIMPAVRCSIPPRPQPGIERDLDIFRTMNAHHGNHLGMYCAPTSPGTVRVGDPVAVGDADGAA